MEVLEMDKFTPLVKVIYNIYIIDLFSIEVIFPQRHNIKLTKIS